MAETGARPRGKGTLQGPATAPWALAFVALLAVTNPAPAQVLRTAPQVAPTATFRLKTQVEVEGERLYLGDIATCEGTGGLCDEAYGVDLGPSPEPGRMLLLTESRIRPLLEAEWPGARLSFQAPLPVKVTSVATEVDEEAVTAALKDRFALLASSAELELRVERVQVPRGLKLRPKAARLVPQGLLDQDLTNEDWVARHLVGNQRFTMACQEADDQAPTLTFPVTATLSLRRRLPVALRDLPRGAVLGAQDVEWRWHELERGGPSYVKEPVALIGRRLRRPVRAGDPFAVGAAEALRPLAKGQLVRLEMRRLGIAVAGQVRLLEAGGIGEVIDAVYPATKKRLKVRVVDASTVTYVF